MHIIVSVFMTVATGVFAYAANINSGAVYADPLFTPMVVVATIITLYSIKLFWIEYKEHKVARAV